MGTSSKETFTFTVAFVETMPPHLQERTLYVSRTYHIAIHLCACGCAKECVTPFDHPEGWQLNEDDMNRITLNPSILNPWCGSHYWIRDSTVFWA